MYENLMKLAIDATGPRTNYCWYPEVTAAYIEEDKTWPPIAKLPLAAMIAGYCIFMQHAYFCYRAQQEDQ